MTDDPFEVLGLVRTATVAELRVARRRLAFELHPDRGGDEQQMQTVNAAFEAAVAHATGRRPLLEPSVATARVPDPGPDPGRGSARTSRPEPVRYGPAGSPVDGAGRWRRVEHDMPSFVIEALPAEAFEALLIVTTWIGEVLVDEPPYLLEVHLSEPAECWCRLELVPDAGASTVSLTVASIGGVAPSVDVVRDTWVHHLNRLGE